MLHLEIFHYFLIVKNVFDDSSFSYFVPNLIPIFLSKNSLKLNFNPTTPIEPVIVTSVAIILSAFIDIQYPPEAASDAIEITTTQPFFFAFIISLFIISEAIADPPGESTRIIIPTEFSEAKRIALAIVSLPIVSFDSPSPISPVA